MIFSTVDTPFFDTPPIQYYISCCCFWILFCFVSFRFVCVVVCVLLYSIISKYSRSVVCISTEVLVVIADMLMLISMRWWGCFWCCYCYCCRFLATKYTLNPNNRTCICIQSFLIISMHFSARKITASFETYQTLLDLDGIINLLWLNVMRYLLLYTLFCTIDIFTDSYNDAQSARASRLIDF